ncbi:MAG TPA: iron-sulfur cluster repair di-iron protein [Pyrinomonadaceae bacterium]|nr:iron-sulfur cluster repair di-iron protein [Pyrinomonadaceae bacterium]
MQTYHTRTVREIALELPLTTRVFEEFKIDYCCHGDMPFDEACATAGTNPDLVIEKIETMMSAAGTAPADGFKATSLRDLIHHIIENHHIFTRNEIRQLMPLMSKVARRHGEYHRNLVEMEEVFKSLCSELGLHLKKEEMVLFPYIEILEAADELGRMPMAPPFGTVNNPVAIMISEHEGAGEKLVRLRSLSEDYTLPEGACPSFTALYHRLEALEKDLHQHIHLENNLLFPKAVELEKQALGPIPEPIY